MSILLCGAMGVKEQTVFGTKASPPVYFVDWTGGLPTMDNALLMPIGVDGQRGDRRAVRGPCKVAWDIPTNGDPENITGPMFKWLFRGVTTSNLGGGAYKHTFNPQLTGCGSPLYFTSYLNARAGKFYLLDNIVSGLDISINAAELLTMTWKTMGTKIQSTSDDNAPTISGLVPFCWADAAVTLNSTSFTQAENFSMSIDAAGEQIFTLNNDITPGKVTQTGWMITGSFTAEFDDMTHFTRFWGDATEVSRTINRVPLIIQFTSIDEIASSGQYYTLKFSMTEVVYTSLGIEAADPNSRIMQNIGFKALIPVAGGADITVELTNGVASY